ncbi:hypothetical protein BUALT_Bualt01G0139600 [Buddleja alternifolia]|uniref:Uncharacterized protein n=1 Tax=Buddleja alternifolia TaxID=168488 RepID=A0AAV6Y7Z1_9LAMI|nr:hypothetical protein BUALT_Bualt01G0139600 [Buddleja alternifolia]
MKAKNRRQRSMLIRMMRMPIRALCKAREFYVQSMINCANSNAIGLQGSSQADGLPRSFSMNSAPRSDEENEDYRELVRAASGRARRGMPPRSSSVGGGSIGIGIGIGIGMGSIDEDRPCCYFGGRDQISNTNELIKYPRSKTYAASATTPSF